ncbi:5'-nucleotidase domain-containing protein 3 [Rhizopus azygosporus]|uniref:5'-nucleotidase domain-containing protein 3 n=1 Tax=Rhizopus azygosporus TaxID=86630 RepID=A0A367K392_RHIAZ|nr:5'-nucleotidase domain-containing protein 3 [Rhizopus azygosporus]
MKRLLRLTTDNIRQRRRQYSISSTVDHRRMTELLKKEYEIKKFKHAYTMGKEESTLPSKNANMTADEEFKTLEGLGYTSPDKVFINNELNLQNIEVYGFDYDYTLANYTENLSVAIYKFLCEILVDVFKYPKQIKDFKFDPDFAIRGLHYDFNNGWLMKIDNMANIQLNTVHVGREPITDVNEVIEYHKGRHIPPEYLNNSMFQLSDLFSIPQTTLLSDVIQYFRDHNMSFHPRYLSDDVNHAARILHTGAHGIGGTLHMEVMKDISKYLERAPKLVGYLETLKKNGKKTFLLTNSTLSFISKGMGYLTSSDDWRDLFDCVIVNARKPEFYRSYRPFRIAHEPNWDSVLRFEPGQIYQGGNIKDFERLTGWKGQRVLYFGDHIYSDLVDASIQHGWHTGAIIHELAKEIEIRNQPCYRHKLSWLLNLERLLNEAQSWSKDHCTDELNKLLSEWRSERNEVRIQLKSAFNEHFGSMFRTYQNPSFFANKIQKFADIYMANITNLDNLSLDYVFYPNRTYLPHERLVEEIVDSGQIKHISE